MSILCGHNMAFVGLHELRRPDAAMLCHLSTYIRQSCLFAHLSNCVFGNLHLLTPKQ